MAAIPLNLYYPAGFWCWIANDQWDPNDPTSKKESTNNYKFYRYVFYFGPLFACFFVIAFCMALLVFTVQRLENASKKYLASSYAQKARDRNKGERKVLKSSRSNLSTKSKRLSSSGRVKRESVDDLRMQDLFQKQEEVRKKRLNRISTRSVDNPTVDDSSRILSIRKSRNRSLNPSKSVSFGEDRHSASNARNISRTNRNSAPDSLLSSGGIAYPRKPHAASLNPPSPDDGNNLTTAGQSQLNDKPNNTKEKAVQHAENQTFEANDGKIAASNLEEKDIEAQIPRAPSQASDESDGKKIDPQIKALVISLSMTKAIGS